MTRDKPNRTFLFHLLSHLVNWHMNFPINSLHFLFYSHQWSGWRRSWNHPVGFPWRRKSTMDFWGKLTMDFWGKLTMDFWGKLICTYHMMVDKRSLITSTGNWRWWLCDPVRHWRSCHRCPKLQRGTRMQLETMGKTRRRQPNFLCRILMLFFKHHFILHYQKLLRKKLYYELVQGVYIYKN